jgi:hypothetical protein
MPEIAKESRPKGASGIQTLYMTGSMKIDENTRASADRRTGRPKGS